VLACPACTAPRDRKASRQFRRARSRITLSTPAISTAWPQRTADGRPSRPPNQALLSVSFGGLRAPGGGWIGVDTRPAAVKNFLTYAHAPGDRSTFTGRRARSDVRSRTRWADRRLVRVATWWVGLSEVAVGTSSVPDRASSRPAVEFSLIVSPRHASFAVWSSDARDRLRVSRGLLSGSTPTASQDSARICAVQRRQSSEPAGVTICEGWRGKGCRRRKLHAWVLRRAMASFR